MAKEQELMNLMQFGDALDNLKHFMKNLKINRRLRSGLEFKFNTLLDSPPEVKKLLDMTIQLLGSKSPREEDWVIVKKTINDIAEKLQAKNTSTDDEKNALKMKLLEFVIVHLYLKLLSHFNSKCKTIKEQNAIQEALLDKLIIAIHTSFHLSPPVLTEFTPGKPIAFDYQSNQTSPLIVTNWLYGYRDTYIEFIKNISRGNAYNDKQYSNLLGLAYKAAKKQPSSTKPRPMLPLPKLPKTPSPFLAKSPTQDITTKAVNTPQHNIVRRFKR